MRRSNGNPNVRFSNANEPPLSSSPGVNPESTGLRDSTGPGPNLPRESVQSAGNPTNLKRDSVALDVNPTQAPVSSGSGRKPRHARQESVGFVSDDVGSGDLVSLDSTIIEAPQGLPPPAPKRKVAQNKNERKEKSCIVKVFYAIFATRQLAGKHDRELYIAYSVRELIIYVGYLMVLWTLTYGLTNATTFYFTRVIFDLFINKPFEDTENTFKTSTDTIDFWDFQSEVLENLYWHEMKGAKRLVEDVSNNSKGFFYENHLMGVARFRQLRVKGEKCPAEKNVYQFVMPECFPSYSSKLEDKGDANGLWTSAPLPNKTKNAWVYKTESQLQSSGSHWGRLAWYSGAGAVQSLENTKAGTAQIVNELKKNLWITSATRVVFLDFTVYNSNINLFCVVRLIWEFSSTGALTTSSSLRPVQLIRYLTDWDNYIIFPCEILFCVFTGYYLIQEILEMIFISCKEYWTDFWTYLDLLILCISGICIGFSFYRHRLVQDKIEHLTVDEDIYHDFDYIAFWQTQFNHAVSVAVFFSVIKIFKYISYNKTMTQLSSTLSRCAKDIGGFAIMFFIVFFAFAQLGHLLFGSQVEDFSTFEDSVFTLLRLILGDFNYRQLEEANRILGPIFFLVYVFFVFFVLLNMFLAIINDTYGEVKAEIQAQRNEFEIADYFKRLWHYATPWFRKKNPKLNAEHLAKMNEGEAEQITYDDLRKHLISANFSEIEVEMFLARYELDQDRALDEEETQQVLADLEEKKITLDTFDEKKNSVKPVRDEEEIAEEEAQHEEEFTNLLDRVTLMETCVLTIQHKMDNILSKLDQDLRNE